MLLSLYPLCKSVGGPQSWSEHYREEKNIFPILGIEPPLLDHLAYGRITILKD
jgi:hypothetical protein